MKILDRYISKTVLSAIAVVTLTLVGFQIFILFMNELDHIGRGGYNLLAAFAVVLYQLPEEVYLFFPVAALIGALIGLGHLASHHELVVFQSSGVSVTRLTWSVIRISMILILLVSLLGEFWAPQLYAVANQKRWQAMTDGQVVLTMKGVWYKHQDDFFIIGNALNADHLTDVVQFHFAPDHLIQTIRHINHLKKSPNTHAWTAYGVRETNFYGQHTQLKAFDQLSWHIPLDIVALKAAQKEPDELGFLALRQYVKSGLYQHDFYPYELAYWRRIAQPFATLVMMILAIPFIFGPLRSSTMGAKLVMGIAVGFSFYMLNQFFGPLAEVLHWPAELAATVPTLMFAVLGGILLSRVRH